MEDPTYDSSNEPFDLIPQAKSSVKLIKNSKGLNWEIKVVAGEEDLMQGLKAKAVEIHNDLAFKMTGASAEELTSKQEDLMLSRKNE